ncbi:MAG: cell division topological specificity factor MinE [Candidatus Eremiobacteraeota bacterium]|nr:cell division topological specificity factor MinE [Candidatus Eremiobacteraeota bacterium]
MLEWIKRFFGQSGSSSAAKERLRFVLMTDHLALAPEMVEQMKRDLVDVISRYVEVDRDNVEVNFEREDRALAMLANIPIKSVNRSSVPEAAAVSAVAPKTETAAAASALEPTADVSVDESAPEADQVGPPPTRARRRRKKRTPANPAAAL